MRYSKVWSWSVQFVYHKRLVIQFHDGLAQDPMLTREKNWSEVKIPESTLNQEVELNYQVKVQDHIHTQVQF